MTPLLLVRATMWLVTIAWAAGEVTMRRSPRFDRLGRACWTIGLALALLHVVLAFEYVHAWSHEAAIAATVRQSEERFGIGWRGGIYVNYVFLAIWLADVSWWWLAPASHRRRALWLERTRLAFFVFMFVNGAVIFAAWPGRLIGIAAVIVVLAALFSRAEVPERTPPSRSRCSGGGSRSCRR